MNLARFKKVLAAVLASAVVLVAYIPTDADPRLVALQGVVTALAVLLGPANQEPKHVAPTLFARQRVRDTEDRPRE